MVRQEQLYIAGEWYERPDTVDVRDLAEGDTFATVAAAGAEDVDRALTAADRATDEMASLSVVERADRLERIAGSIEANEELLANVVVREAGKPISGARGEVTAASERFRRAAEALRARTGDFYRGSTEGHEGWEAIVRHEPLGIVACIGPYNYPLSTVAGQVAPALAAGNSVVLKPSSRTPVVAAILARLIDETDALPAGAFNYVPGHGSEIGDLLAGDDRLDAIAMTGSSPAGERVARHAGITRLHLELGGNAPGVVFADADVDATAADCAAGAVKYAGQRCSAISRVLVQDGIQDDLVAALDDAMAEYQPGDLFDEATAVGPLIDEEHAEWVESLIDDAVERGATLVRGGDRDRATLEPTLLADVPPAASIVEEEHFGPVLPVVGFEGEAEATAIVNEDDYALDAAVFTNDYDRARRVADRVTAGSVRINGAPSHGIGDVPFGGTDASGIGRQGLGVTLEAFSRRKTIVL